MSKDMADKAVETETSAAQDNNSDVQDGAYWKVVQLESLLAALVNSKVVAIKANRGSKAFLRKPSDGVAPTSPTHHDLRYHKHHSHHHGHHKHHRHHHQGHHKHHKKLAPAAAATANATAAAVCKVKQWDDGSATMVHLSRDASVTAETHFCHGGAMEGGEEEDEDEEGCRCHYKMRPDDTHFVTVDMELDDLDLDSGPAGVIDPRGHRPRRKRRKRKQLTDHHKRKQLTDRQLMYAHAREAAAK
ncbi:uncharacterized protein LOC111046929 [Nilaparvata lugens]|uniref:uncharacterized protein LOC111046929 n=1 Tax=Nilaparvata lugens TaxID=108931 RepID=UPI00193E0A75|nr:uncharacterized protein LOC111046929 [Nilaparvata lugens]XP_039290900.1 uncharacterized protein LOC111046929 [Nilaparvata lugens]XP_039290901.1 uncharacterized protein LOC111046929 [Nilaparvata lugens]